MKHLLVFLCLFMIIPAFSQKNNSYSASRDRAANSEVYTPYELETDYDQAIYLGDDSWKIILGDGIGYYEFDAGEVLPPVFQGIVKLDATTIGIKVDHAWAIYSEGEFVTDFIFSHIIEKKEDYFVVIMGNSLGHYKDGEFVEKSNYFSSFDQPPQYCDPETGNCNLTQEEAIQVLNRYIIYPSEARENGEKGKVMLALFISEFGDIDEIIVEKSAGRSLDKAAIKLFTEHITLFRPAEKDGIPIPSIVRFPLRYRLD